MKNQQCPKPDCMYLHELGDLEASFTKEEMYQGKHQEYEKRLHDSLIAQTAAAAAAAAANNSSPNGKSGKANKQLAENSTQSGPEKNKDAWPSLSTSPVNKETTKSGKNGNHKENAGKKTKSEKAKNKKPASVAVTTGNGNSNDNHKEANANSSTSSNNSTSSGKDTGFNITKDAMSADNMETPKPSMSADEELNLISEIENDALSADSKADTPSLR